MSQTAEPRAKPAFTRRDLMLFPDDGKRRELIEGDIYVAPSPNLLHQRLVRRLVRIIDVHLQAHREGELFVAPFDLLLPGESTVQPDLFYVSRERAAIIGKGGVEGVPDWTIEVLSPSNRDYDLETKRTLYRRAGVPLHWIVDPEAETVQAWEGDALTVYLEADVATVSLLPGFALPLPVLFDPAA